MKKVTKVSVGILIMVIAFQPTWAQKEKYHSIFIYNFSKYVKWPPAQSSGKFVIAVFGNSSIQKDLKIMSASKQANGLPIEIRQYRSIGDIKDCHILYVSASESGKIDQIISKTQNQPVLIITDKPGLANRGAAINFIEVDGKIKFELNPQNAVSKGLKIASSLTKLAILV